MIFKSVCRIVCGADYLNARALNKVLCGIFGKSEKSVTFIPNSLTALFIQLLVDAEVGLKLKVSPVIHRVTDKKGERFCKSKELLVIGSLARYVLLVDAV